MAKEMEKNRKWVFFELSTFEASHEIGRRE